MIMKMMMLKILKMQTNLNQTFSTNRSMMSIKNGNLHFKNKKTQNVLLQEQTLLLYTQILTKSESSLQLEFRKVSSLKASPF